MKLLSDSIKKTISIADGYQLGRLIIDEEPYIKTEKGEVRARGLIVEVLNGAEWYRLGADDYEKKTEEGWPLFAGADCRYKEV